VWGEMYFGILFMHSVHAKTLQKAENSEFCTFAKFKTRYILYFPKKKIIKIVSQNFAKI